MEQAVEATRMVVNTRVMSSFKIPKVPRLPSFSSSSANSRTFHGYNVVMAISAACNKAKPEKRARKSPARESSSFLQCLLMMIDVETHQITKRNQFVAPKSILSHVPLHGSYGSSWGTSHTPHGKGHGGSADQSHQQSCRRNNQISLGASIASKLR